MKGGDNTKEIRISIVIKSVFKSPEWQGCQNYHE
jgi:hypothetical protein